MIIRFKITTGFVVIILLFINSYWTLYLYFSDQCNNINKAYPTGLTNSKQISNDKTNVFIPLTNNPLNVVSSRNDEIAFSNINFWAGRWDQQRVYKFYDFALVGNNHQTSDESLVCLATQSSIERINSLAQVARQWNGPMSVAVFVAGNDEFKILQYYVTYLRMCFNYISDNVTFHVAVHHLMQPNTGIYSVRDLATRFDCQYTEQTLRRLLRLRSDDTLRWRLKNIYPQNHMRNLARKGCQNKYVFLTDIDIIPSSNIVPELNRFLSTTVCNNLCAYVIPTFEIDVRAKFPGSKTELLRLFKKNLARPFHEKVFIYNQYATNFSRWITTDDSDAAVHISHTVTNFEFLYEPFYVGLDNMPIHDERFLGYGFTRNSQVYELYIAGYTFFVLSPLFTCHWGLQQKKMRPAWREQQNNINRERFDTFKSEITARYKNNPLSKLNSKKYKRSK